MLRLILEWDLWDMFISFGSFFGLVNEVISSIYFKIGFAM